MVGVSNQNIVTLPQLSQYKLFNTVNQSLRVLYNNEYIFSFISKKKYN